MNSIYPTGKCFDDALDALCEMVKASPEKTDDIFLVHGLCRAPDGNLYVHAWVEWTAGATVRCLFAGILDGVRSHFACERTEYYAEVHVEETTHYTPKEALSENWHSEHYGPWVPRYRDHCTLPVSVTEDRQP